MSIKFAGKAIVLAALFGSALIMSAASQAALIISGQFTLQQDINLLNGPQVGDVVASVAFDAVDTGTVVNGLSVFDVIRLELTDLTSLLNLDGDNDITTGSLIGNFLFDPAAVPAGSSTVTSVGLEAFFDSNAAFAGIDGDLIDSNPLRTVFFNLNGGVSLSTSTAGTYNSGTAYIDTFNQVPETGALALFGAGLIAFGVVRRRNGSKSKG